MSTCTTGLSPRAPGAASWDADVSPSAPGASILVGTVRPRETMSKLDEILARSSCAACGAGVYRNDAGRVACNTCNLPTEECECGEAEKPDMNLPI